MKNIGKVEKRFLLLCDLDGRVEQVLRDDDHVLPPSLTGSMIFSAITAGDLDKLLNFTLELKMKGTAIGWEINVAGQNGPETYSFFGGIFNDQIGIAAATTKSGAQILFAELTKINNEQTNIIRAVSKQNAKLQNGSNEPGVFYYEELSRLNNELVNMQRELAKKNRELDELNKLKNQFLGIAAHDLRNPIGVVIAYSEFMLEEKVDPDIAEHNELIRRIHGIGKFMLGLVNDLLDIANIESGKLELNISKQEIRALIRETIRMNDIFIRAKSMKIIFDESGVPVTAMIDRPKIEQVFTNLLSNAIKYSFPGSKIIIGLESDGNTARITVRDQGQGIRKEELKKLFKPFQRTSTRSTGGEKSTGLGLLIVKKIIEAHQGEVGVTSEPVKGAEFFFTLPVKPATLSD